MAEEKSNQGNDFKHIVRVSNTDLDGNKPFLQALRKIKGISFMLANAVCNLSGIDPSKKTGELGDQEIKKVNDIISKPQEYDVPTWMLNRRKDPEQGDDKHLLAGDLKFQQENDIKMMRKMKSYRGVRHSRNLPVRGQRTKANFRRNKGKSSLGVKKRAGAKSGRS